MATFRAFRVERQGGDAGELRRAVVERDTAELPEGDLLIDVAYSSLNYKDGLSITGNPGVTRRFPHQPGIDAAGTVVESRNAAFPPGSAVLVYGYDLGMNTDGGFGQRIRVPAAWASPCPEGLGLEEAMIIGTAGVTAALCLQKIERMGGAPTSGPLLVTGASGGVGCIAVMLAAQLGYEVVAVSGKADRVDWLKALGAAEVVGREALQEDAKRPLLAERWGGVVDTVGGDMLFNAIKGLRYGASAACCGLVNDVAIPATVLPFILRNVNLLGVDSVELPIEEKQALWQRLAGDWKPAALDAVKVPLTLDTLSEAVDRILAGEMVGRGLVDLRA
jgi:acrylyl-CoA reductase (NADPH)